MAHQTHRFKPRSATRMRRLMNTWPPLRFAGVRIVAWDADYTRVVVRSAKPWSMATPRVSCMPARPSRTMS